MLLLSLISRERQMDGKPEESSAAQQSKYVNIQQVGCVCEANATKSKSECPNSNAALCPHCPLQHWQSAMEVSRWPKWNGDIWRVATRAAMQPPDILSSSCGLSALCSAEGRRRRRGGFEILDTQSSMEFISRTDAICNHDNTAVGRQRVVNIYQSQETLLISQHLCSFIWLYLAITL